VSAVCSVPARAAAFVPPPALPDVPDVPAVRDDPPVPRPPRRRPAELDLVPPLGAFSTRSTSPGCASRSTSGWSAAPEVSPSVVPAPEAPAPERPFPPRPRPPRRRRRRAGVVPVSVDGSVEGSVVPATAPSVRVPELAGDSPAPRGARRGRVEPVAGCVVVSSCCCTGAGATAPGPCGASSRTRKSSSGRPPGRGPPGANPGPAKPAPRLSSLAVAVAARWPRARRAGLRPAYQQRVRPHRSCTDPGLGSSG
jgi:hypothetical protein